MLWEPTLRETQNWWKNSSIKLTHGETIISKCSSYFIFLIQFLFAAYRMFYKVKSLKVDKIQKNNWANKIWICYNRHSKNYKQNFFSATEHLPWVKCLLLRAFLPSPLKRIPSIDTYPAQCSLEVTMHSLEWELTLRRFRPTVKHKKMWGAEIGFTLPQNVSTFNKAILPSAFTAHPKALLI